MAKSEAEAANAQRVLRITDIIQESLEFLAPIGGYENMPLVSLEKAVEPLVSILPAVQSHAYVAKQKCKKPADELTQDESASIMLYTMGWEPLDQCLYVVLNDTLRSSNRQQQLRPWYLYLRLFLNALYRLPPLRETTYRGVKADMAKGYNVGDTLVWWGFSSCTVSVGVLESNLFLGQMGARTMFTIQCETGRNIYNHSFYPSEDEILLLAASQFKVTSRLNQGDLCIIQLKETQPPFPLLQPVPIISPMTKSSTTSE
jgi:hypothetical protein